MLFSAETIRWGRLVTGELKKLSLRLLAVNGDGIYSPCDEKDYHLGLDHAPEF